MALSLSSGRNMSRAAATAVGVGAYAARRAIDNVVDRFTRAPSGPIVVESKTPTYMEGYSQGRRAARASGRTTKRRRGRGIITRRSNPPTTLGWSVSSNNIGRQGACTRFGLKGVRISGNQFYCYVNTAAAATQVLQSPDTVGAAGNFANGFFLHPSIINRQVQRAYLNAGAGILGYPASSDPLRSHAIVYSHYLFTKVIWTYLPKVGSNTAGAITLGWTSDRNQLKNQADVDGPTQVEKHAISVTGPVWEKQVLDISQMLDKSDLYETNSDYTQLTEPFVRRVTQGILLASHDGVAASIGCGRIMISYEIELYDERPYPNLATAASGT